MKKKEKITMFTRRLIHGYMAGILILFFLSVTGGTAAGVEYNLAAGAATINYAGTDITMWGFAQCTDSTFTSCDPVTVPGPQLTVPPGETLTINLRNNLTVPVSIIIPGQSIVPSPTDVGGRVMSFTTETAPGGTVLYTWANFKPGTFIYQSGTNPAVQVQMGLYGAVKKDFAAGQAYNSTATQYASEIVLLFSEIDPALHQAVADGKYGADCAVPPCTMTSTVDFKPKYFLINGKPFTVGLPHIPAGTAGKKTLLRFLNAGLRDYVPLLQDLYMKILAEDGNLLPYPKKQYSLILPAGKTTDATIKPAAGTYALYDRRLNLTNGALSPGGMLTYLDVAP
jgi:FtsP/CotA-like multicopper oxidase with cupredoxin domain